MANTSERIFYRREGVLALASSAVWRRIETLLGRGQYFRTLYLMRRKISSFSRLLGLAGSDPNTASRSLGLKLGANLSGITPASLTPVEAPTNVSSYVAALFASASPVELVSTLRSRFFMMIVTSKPSKAHYGLSVHPSSFSFKRCSAARPRSSVLPEYIPVAEYMYVHVPGGFTSTARRERTERTRQHRHKGN